MRANPVHNLQKKRAQWAQIRPIWSPCFGNFLKITEAPQNIKATILRAKVTYRCMQKCTFESIQIVSRKSNQLSIFFAGRGRHVGGRHVQREDGRAVDLLVQSDGKKIRHRSVIHFSIIWHRYFNLIAINMRRLI
jgi:hypothetical protein